MDAALAIAPDDGEAAELDELLRSGPPAFPHPGRPGRFAHPRFLGSGLHKDVWSAHDTLFDRPVAVVRVRTEEGLTRARDRTFEEIRAIGRIGAHPNLVGLHEVTEGDDEIILIEEFMVGGTLAGLLDRAPGRVLAIDEAVRIAVGLCHALAAVHSHGFIHADVKPRNVFLDAAGIPRLGDFGSALSSDRRAALREIGIVGTALYLAPELALGEETGPWTDLYSLGAVLYEMVAGRPPFRGDDATRVIAQHIRDTPVAPSWLNDACPAAVEDVILRLLAKGPGQRFASAGVVAETLEAAINHPALSSMLTARQREKPLERLAAGAFVGRLRESKALEEFYERAERGNGSAILVAGDAGMGKSRLVEQLTVLAKVRGGQVFLGRSRETPGAPAYWPWIEVGTAFVAEAGHEPISEAGDSARELVRMFGALRVALPDLPPPDEDSRDPVQARMQLFAAYGTLVAAAASRGPTLIVLEDLHAADDASVALLDYLVQRLGALRILIVATYRPDHGGEPGTVRDIQRIARRADHVTLLTLAALSETEVGDYLEEAAGLVPPRHVVAEIWGRTDGNPFFVVEVVKYLAESGQLFSTQRIRLPESISTALGLRVEKLSAPAASLLRDASVFGREFRSTQLAALEESSEADIDALLLEASRARMIEAMTEPGHFRFVHALMRDALLGQLDAGTLSDLHGRAGRVLEAAWGGHTEARASRLAEHFFAACEPDGRYRPAAIRYSEIAARQARDSFSWSEAARHYRRCVQLLEGSDDLQELARTLEAHGVCARNGGHIRPAWTSLTRAIDYYADAGDAISVARTTLTAVAIPSEERASLVSRALDLIGDEAPEFEGLLLTHRLRLRGLASPERQRLEERLRRLVLAEPEAGFVPHARALAASRALESGELTAAASLAERAFTELNAAGEREAAVVALLVSAMAWTQLGDLDKARDGYANVMRQAAGARLHYMTGVCAMALAGLHRMRCEFEEYEQMLSLIPADNWTRQIFAAERAEHAGDSEKCAALLPSASVAAGVVEWQMILHGSRARMLFNAFGPLAAQLDFGHLQRTIHELTADSDESLAEAITSATPVETAIGLADECFIALAKDEEIEQMYGRLMAHHWMRTAGDFRQLDRIRGALALRLGREGEAAAHFQAGLDWCERERCPIEAGRCLQGLAETARRAGDGAGALAFLNRAALSFAGYETQLFLGQVVAEKLRLQGALGRDPESSIDLADVAGPPLLAASLGRGGISDVTIVFTDIDESTPLTERLGDAAWVGLLRAHNAIVRAELVRFGGREIKTIGDAFMLAFESPVAALHFSASLQRALAARNTAAETPIRVAIGVHTGRAVNERGDFIGLDVVVASRLCSSCEPDEILATADVRDAVRAFTEFRFESRGTLALKGVSAPQAVFAISWDGEVPA